MKKLSSPPKKWMNDMENRKFISILIIFFIFAIIAGCRPTAEKQVNAKRLFPERHGWDLRQISISDANTTLDFRRINCVWVVGDGNKQSDEPRVADLAEKLVSLAPQKIPAIEPERFQDFKVGNDSFSRKIVLTFKDSSSYIMLIGTPAITKPAYIRLADKNQVYGTDEPLLRQINLDSDSWLAAKDG
jgi:hypothetical protein